MFAGIILAVAGIYLCGHAGALRERSEIRDTLIWFGLLIGLGSAGYHLWGTWWAIIPFAAYGVIYGQHVFDYKAENHTEVRRNFSLASNPEMDGRMYFNVRISTPPRGQDCNAGVGSSYIFFES